MIQIVPQPENLIKLVFLIHGQKVLLDADLAGPEDKTRKAKRPIGFL